MACWALKVRCSGHMLWLWLLLLLLLWVRLNVIRLGCWGDWASWWRLVTLDHRLVVAEAIAVGGDGRGHVTISNAGPSAESLVWGAVDVGSLGGERRWLDRGRWGSSARDGGLLGKEVCELARDLGVVGARVLAGEGNGWLMKMLREGE